tara:strand:- start:1558 stop:2226 length:669 start_codon:yes stop_codon:yes gene_type:complete
MKLIIKKILPTFLFVFISNQIKKINFIINNFFLNSKIRSIIKNNKDLKIIIGAADTAYPGWISTNIYSIDLLNSKSFDKYFNSIKINNILAEHVFEHLTYEEGIVAAKNCYDYMAVDGRMRVAVPDGYFPSQEYIEYVKPGGVGPGCDDHKVLYNYKLLSEVFKTANFKVSLLEYFDENHQFHKIDWSDDLGLIKRSLKYDERNKDDKIKYTSIILDAIKTK